MHLDRNKMLSKRRIILTNLVLMGILAALATGIAIGVQSTLSSRIGGLIGSFKTGVLMNATGGLIAMLIFITLLLVKGKGFWQTPVTAIIMLIVAGALGIFYSYRCFLFNPKNWSCCRYSHPDPWRNGTLHNSGCQGMGRSTTYSNLLVEDIRFISDCRRNLSAAAEKELRVVVS